MASPGNWCLIESDPAVFTELVEKFGVTGAQLEEVYCMDDSSFLPMKPVHGLIFLFKIDKETKGDEDGRRCIDPPERMFFAKQVISNACATQAILSVLMNVEHEQIKLGDNLTEFKEFTQSFEPKLKGLALSNCDAIRDVHNSFARQTLFEIDSQAPTKEEDLYHFISYMPFEGRIYEMDGLQDGPIDLGEIKEGQDWLALVKPLIEKRMTSAQSGGEIRFNLMAITSDKKMIYEKQLEELMASADKDNESISSLQEMIAAEVEKKNQWKMENIRRRHNYLPLIVNMLKMLADKEKLMPIFNQAKKRTAEVSKTRSKLGMK